MSTLTATARGQITLRREFLQHLGVRPGDRIDVEKLPNGEVRLRSAKQKHGVESFIGLLAGKTRKTATVEEIEAATQAGWAGQVSFED